MAIGRPIGLGLDSRLRGNDSFSNPQSPIPNPQSLASAPLRVAANREGRTIVTDSRRILIALATYNEIDNLPAVVGSLRRQLPIADILVIDDNSPDGTGQWCDEQAARDDRFHSLHRPAKQGLGTATVAAMRYAVENDYTYLATLDADHSHDPADVPVLLAAMEKDGESVADVALGSRYTPGGGVEGWPLFRRVSSRGVNVLARLLLGLKVRDASGALRCYRVATLRQLDLDSLTSRGYSIYEETLWHLSCVGARIVEKPIVFVDRKKGSSKLNAREAVRSLVVLFRLGARHWCGMRPRRPSSSLPRESAAPPSEHVEETRTDRRSR